MVAEQIRASIFNGDYRPGSWLRQQHLADDLGVSQIPVREALKELTVEGLVEHIPYKGARVLAIKAEDIEDIYAQRIFLEGRAAKIAASRITPEELDQLRQLHQEMLENLSPEQIITYRRLNRRFHELIYTASRRQYLIRVLNQLWATYPTMLWGNFAQTAVSPLPARDATDQEEHAAIIQALANRDGDDAEQQMHAHISAVAAALLATLVPQ
jgi:DNA-binding GntR family transcriptional regulator